MSDPGVLLLAFGGTVMLAMLSLALTMPGSLRDRHSSPATGIFFALAIGIFGFVIGTNLAATEESKRAVDILSHDFTITPAGQGHLSSGDWYTLSYEFPASASTLLGKPVSFPATIESVDYQVAQIKELVGLEKTNVTFTNRVRAAEAASKGTGSRQSSGG